MDYVNHICEDFVELHGDREGMDDRAIIGGLAKIDGKPVMIIGTMKGKSTKENPWNTQVLVCLSLKVTERL